MLSVSIRDGSLSARAQSSTVHMHSGSAAICSRLSHESEPYEADEDAGTLIIISKVKGNSSLPVLLYRPFSIQSSSSPSSPQAAAAAAAKALDVITLRYAPVLTVMVIGSRKPSCTDRQEQHFKVDLIQSILAAPVLHNKKH